MSLSYELAYNLEMDGGNVKELRIDSIERVHFGFGF